MNHAKRAVSSLAITATTVLLSASIAGCHHEAPQPTTPPPVTVAQTPPPPPPPPRERPHQVVTEEWVELPFRILYPLGGSRLDDEARALLREAHASVAHRTDIIRVSVEGHTDSRGMRETNERLGLERAQGVVDFLVGDLGMPRELFEVHSFGDTRPITSCTTAADCLQNRRVEFRILVRRTAAM